MGFSQQYLDHFSNPRGIGEIDSPDLMSEVAHEGGGCFDKVRLTLRLEGERITEAKFRARACSGTIACCSALVEMVKTKTIPQALSLNAEMIVDYLGGIPKSKQHSVDLAIRAMKIAIESNDNISQT